MYELSNFFMWIIGSSLMGSILILAIILIKSVLKSRINMHWHYYIWLLLLIRLIVPYGPRSEISVFNLLTPLVSSAAQETNKVSTAEKLIITGSTKVKTIVPSTKILKPMTAAEKKLPTFDRLYKVTRLNIIFPLLWLAGASFCLIHSLQLNMRFWKKIKSSAHPAEKEILSLLEECKSSMNIHAQIPVILTEAIRSPSLLGVYKPKLLLPVPLIHQIRKEELRCILLHELTHYKRKDILMNWISVILKALHWFNPIIWYGFYRMHQDCEVSCDAFVLSRMSQEEQMIYGNTILHLLTLSSAHKFIPGTAAILNLSSKTEIKRRITMISMFKKPSYKGVIAAVAIFSIIGATCLTNAQQTLATDLDNNISILQAQSVFLPKDKTSAVTLWAESLKKRDSSFRYAILTNELKQQEYAKYNDMNWVIGGSSPWVISYKITETNKIDEETSEFQIEYTLTDSTKASYNAHEALTVKKLGNHWFVSKHDDYDYLPDITENEGTKYVEVQPKLFNTILFPRDKEATAQLWAESLKERDGSFRFALLTRELKQQEYEKYNEMNWVIGGSSPRVTDYKVSEINAIDEETSQFRIDYTLTDSTNTLYDSHETITLKRHGNDWVVISHDNYDYLPEVTPRA